jgi:hypothetical protein
VGSFPVDAQPHNPRGGGLAEAVAHAHVRGLAGERGAARRQADRTAGVAARRDHATRFTMMLLWALPLTWDEPSTDTTLLPLALPLAEAMPSMASRLLRISMSPTLVKLVILFLTSP